MAEPERTILDWAEPTAAAAARWLLGRRAANPGVDLSDILVIVPTQRAARKLREELARSSLAGVLSPRTITPAQFLRPADPDIAEPAEATLTFLDVLEAIPRRDWEALFPLGLPFRSFAERAGFARTFFALRASLADGGWDLRSAARHLADHPDAARWTLLALLDTAYLEALDHIGCHDRESRRLAQAKAPSISGDLREIVLIGVPDLAPLAAGALAALPASVSTHVLISAPPGALDDFDPWGRPTLEAWGNRSPGWTNFDRQVHLCARGEDVAVTLAAILPAATKPDPAFLEIGALDRGLLPWIRNPIENAGGTLHDPEGESLDRHWLGRLLSGWRAFLDDAGFPGTGDLLRNGAVAAWLVRRVPGFALAEALAEADRILADHFPTAADRARAHCRPGGSLRRALDRLLQLRDRLLEPSWIPTLRTYLAEVTEAMADSLSAPEREPSNAATAAIANALDQIEPLVARHPDLAPADWLQLVTDLLATQRSYAEAAPDSIEASGWLELPWSEAPHLVLVGFSQGIVPARLAPDPFLAPGIRQQLGLPSEEARAARDAYFLARLLASRQAGRVDVLVCQIDAEGAPGQPSPLLFAGSGDALPGRVRRLFADPRPAAADPPWEAVWTLDPPAVQLEKRLRVTGFREYLACPFEFYLRFGLGMDFFDPAPAEMDARVFGTLVHDTLEAFSKDPATRDLADAREIRAAVSDRLDVFVETRFEMPLSLPLLVQVEAARQRLRAFAEGQAAERREGWRIAHAEITFSEYLGGRSWLLDGWEIRGKIDRIDHHEATGRWRVLDYKTSEKSEPPPRMHIRGGSAANHGWPPEYALVDPESSKAPKWWTNLQLPLYRQLLIEAGHDPTAIACGYFNLPKAVSATGIAEWPDFDDALGASALRCARGVLADIDRRRFWPPNPRAKYPQNAGWFHPDPERTVAAGSLIRALPAR